MKHAEHGPASRTRHHRSGVRSIGRSLGVVVVTFVVLGAVAAACAGASKSASRVPRVTSGCAWPIATNAETLSENALFDIHNPDAAADYWLMTFVVQHGLRITLSGQYPRSRYMSFAIYSSLGTAFRTNGVASTLTDDRIAPDRGSVNPWQHPAPPGGRFTVTLRSVVKPGQRNTLPLAPAETPASVVGVIFLRVYAPAQKDFKKIPLPAVTVTLDGISKRIATCPATARPSRAVLAPVLPVLGLPANYEPPTSAALAGPPATPGAPGTIVPFAAYPTSSGGTVDTDIAYLSAPIVPPQNGDVLVIRAKAPSTPRGSNPVPWPKRGDDMRYWSICDDLKPSPVPVVINRLPNGKVDEGCRYDSQIKTDRDGYYTIVVGPEAERAAIERIRGTTFLPFSTADPTQVHKLNMRNMLPNPTFRHAIQDVPQTGDPMSAAAAMGSYYPRTAFCSLATLSTRGPDACLTNDP